MPLTLLPGEDGELFTVLDHTNKTIAEIDASIAGLNFEIDEAVEIIYDADWDDLIGVIMWPAFPGVPLFILVLPKNLKKVVAAVHVMAAPAGAAAAAGGAAGAAQHPDIVEVNAIGLTMVSFAIGAALCNACFAVRRGSALLVALSAAAGPAPAAAAVLPAPKRVRGEAEDKEGEEEDEEDMKEDGKEDGKEDEKEDGKKDDTDDDKDEDANELDI
eukprot:gene53738-33858_t